MPYNQVVTSRIAKLYHVKYDMLYQLPNKVCHKYRYYRSKYAAQLDVEELLSNVLVVKVTVRDDFGHSKDFFPKKRSAFDEECIKLILADEDGLKRYDSQSLADMHIETRAIVESIMQRPKEKALKDIYDIEAEWGFLPKASQLDGEHLAALMYIRHKRGLKVTSE